MVLRNVHALKRWCYVIGMGSPLLEQSFNGMNVHPLEVMLVRWIATWRNDNPPLTDGVT